MKTQAECGQPTGCRRIPARFLFASLFALLLCAPVSLWGQATGGRVRGTVSDPSGAVIPAIKVSLASEATRATRDTQTNSNGDYVFLEVPVGTYTIESGAQGSRSTSARASPSNSTKLCRLISCCKWVLRTRSWK